MEKLTYKTQKELIEYSIKNEIPFEEILSKNGLDYNSLVYSDEAKIEDFSFSEFTPVNERKPVASNIPCVSFFSARSCFSFWLNILNPPLIHFL